MLREYVENMYNDPDKNEAMYYKQTFLFLMQDLCMRKGQASEQNGPSQRWHLRWGGEVFTESALGRSRLEA